MVILDENARMHELTTLMAISSFPTAELVILLGDPNQLKPHISSYGAEELASLFDAQVVLSCINRLVQAGVTTPGLNHNHRQYAGLWKEPSFWFYNNKMVPGIDEQFPPSALTALRA
ncbi:hypothetical protein GGR54DRAFT_53980 [Hypoxylon sp. NC1633]|nr:hypothetical protein GGR54DRAFT_53980 [Hypoxylon sp. NC1633]